MRNWLADMGLTMGTTTGTIMAMGIPTTIITIT